MSDGHRMKIGASRETLSPCRNEADSAMEDVSLSKLPPAIQSLITQQWQVLKRELENEEMLIALECFSHYVAHRPAPQEQTTREQLLASPIRALLERLGFVQPSPQETPRRQQPLAAPIRVLFERLGFVQRPDVSDEEIVYRFGLLSEFFERALEKLTEPQRRLIKLLGAVGRFSIKEIARLMNFSSHAALETFQRSAFGAVAQSLLMLLNMELEQPDMEARRKAVLTEWRELFFKKTAAVI